MRATSGTPHSVAQIWIGASAFLVGLALATLPLAGQAATGKASTEISADGYTSARVCGRCHSDIYKSWRNSLHAISLTDPIFDVAFMQAVREGGEEAKRLCLTCHAPMTLVNGDYDLEQGVTREGVSCDFCHTVTAVHLDQLEKPFSTDPGLVKRSILKKASSPAHEVAYSELHGTSEFCGGCHNYVTPSGTAIMSTYDEWRHGPYAEEGVQCQSCHMVLSPGRVVRQEVKAAGTKIHLHDLIHDSEQLQSAVDVRILRAEREGRRLMVEVEIENSGSGHKVPTGMPTREIVLSVEVDDGRGTETRERRYHKVIGDAKGRPLTEDYEVLLRGAKILSDNRLDPREARLERFVFDVPRTGRVKVRAAASYVYSPMALRRQHLTVRLGQAERAVY